ADERPRCGPVTVHLGWLLGDPLVVQGWVPWHVRHRSVLPAAGFARLARLVRYQHRGHGCSLLGSWNLRASRMSGQLADPFRFNVDLPWERVLLFQRWNRATVFLGMCANRAGTARPRCFSDPASGVAATGSDCVWCPAVIK